MFNVQYGRLWRFTDLIPQTPYFLHKFRTANNNLQMLIRTVTIWIKFISGRQKTHSSFTDPWLRKVENHCIRGLYSDILQHTGHYTEQYFHIAYTKFQIPTLSFLFVKSGFVVRGQAREHFLKSCLSIHEVRFTTEIHYIGEVGTLHLE
jgi:hypothetical protein